MSHKGRYRSRSRSRSPRRKSRRSRSRSRSYEPRRHRSGSHSPLSSRRRHTGSRENPPANRCLGVFGLSTHTTEDEIHRFFSKYGPVERIQVVIDAKSGRSRGFAFCYFESVEDAQIAKDQCNGMDFDGRRIRVDFSITQRAHTPTPGVYMGKPTYVDRDHRDRDYGGGGGRGGWRRDYYDDYRGRRSPSPYYSRARWRHDRSRSRSFSPRRY